MQAKVSQGIAAKALIGAIWDNLPKGGPTEFGEDIRNSAAKIIEALYPEAWAKREKGCIVAGHESLDILTFSDGSQMALNEQEVCEYPFTEAANGKSLLDALFGRAN